MKKTRWIVAAATLTSTTTSFAYEVRTRFVEQIGQLPNAFVELDGNRIVTNGEPRRIRVQFGVFDDAESPAPAGGFVGWNVGTLAVSGAMNNSDDRRTPGRLAPFTFAPQVNANGHPPAPGGDPFTMLTAIDATLGTQSPLWPIGMPLPDPTLFGLNTYVSVYEITVDPADSGATDYSIMLGGNVIAATEWRMIGTPVPPEDSDDMCDFPPYCGPFGAVTWAPIPTVPRAISAVLNVVIPAPAASTLLVGIAVLIRRRRG